jgi:hypothetical protein
MTSTDTAVISPVSATEWFIAVPGDDQASGIFGAGTSFDYAIQDVATRSGWREPTIRQDEDLHWVVSTDTGEDAEFLHEGDARAYAHQKGFVALPCTKRLYDLVVAGETPSRWTTDAAGLQDIEA